MSAYDELIEEMRDLRKELAGERQRNTQRVLEGTIQSVKGARATVLLSDDGDDGPVQTPSIRLAAPTGKRGGGVSEFTKYGVGDPVLVISPSGKVGSRSVVIPGGDSGDDPAPGAAEQDGKVTAMGDAKVEIRDGMIRLTVAGTTLTLSASGVAINGQAVDIAGATLRHNGANVGSTHRHPGVAPGGAQTSTPV